MTTNYSTLIDVLAILSEQSGRSATPDSDLVDDLGLDSLDLVSVCLTIEEKFGLADIDYDPATMATPKDIAAFIDSRLAERVQ